MALALLLFCVQDTIDNPEYQAWSRFKVGSYVAYKVTTDDGTLTTEIEQFHELVELTAAKAVVRTKTRSKGKDLNTVLRDIPAKIAPAAAPKASVSTGEQVVEVAGKKLQCLWTEKQYQDGTYQKTYTSPDMPGNLVALRQDIAGVKTEILVTKYGLGN
jgi:hypothetical protein